MFVGVLPRTFLIAKRWRWECSEIKYSLILKYLASSGKFKKLENARKYFRNFKDFIKNNQFWKNVLSAKRIVWRWLIIAKLFNLLIPSVKFIKKVQVNLMNTPSSWSSIFTIFREMIKMIRWISFDIFPSLALFLSNFSRSNYCDLTVQPIQEENVENFPC